MTHNLPSSESLFKEKASKSNLEESREIQILFEYEKLVDYSPQGLFILPDLKSLHVWHGIIFIRSGLYQGGVFRFIIEIPQNYPLSIPKVIFTSSIFHPLIDPNTGELNLDPKFPQWIPKKHFIFLILRYLKSVFLQKDFWSNQKFVKNKQAFEIFITNLEVFQEEVRKTIMECMQSRPGVNSLLKIDSFSSEHDALLRKIKEIGVEENAKEFMSWFYNQSLPK